MKNRSKIKDVLLMLSISVGITAIFVVYLLLVGIPTTTAHNYYNQAMASTNYYEKRTLLKQSLQIWYTDSAAQELQTVEDLLGQK